MPEIMTTKEISKYLRVHQITICKYAAQGVIPAIRVGRVWRFDLEEGDSISLVGFGEFQGCRESSQGRPQSEYRRKDTDPSVQDR